MLDLHGQKYATTAIQATYATLHTQNGVNFTNFQSFDNNVLLESNFKDSLGPEKETGTFS